MPHVITLCGSLRFADDLARLEVELSLAGHVVLAPVRLAAGRVPTPQERDRLGEVHLRKVAMADEVVVVSPGGHVGESTALEVERAGELGIPVRYVGQP